MERIFEEMVDRISPKLHGITHKLNGHFSFFNEDDLYQEALIHLWIAFNKGGLSEKNDSYILQGCFYHLKNYLRKTLDKSRLESLDRILEDDVRPLEKFLATEDSSFMDRIDEEFLKKEFIGDRLNREEAKIVALSMDGLTVREIGARLGVSHVMVVKIRKRIRKRLSFPRWTGMARMS